MTLRELIQSCSHASMFDILRSRHYSEESTSNLIEHSIKYRKIGVELISLPKKLNLSLKIHITKHPSFGICLHDEDKGEFLPIDVASWEDLIDMEVCKAIEIDNNQSLAHILWELFKSKQELRS
jgi:hypothetical protein